MVTTSRYPIPAADSEYLRAKQGAHRINYRNASTDNLGECNEGGRRFSSWVSCICGRFSDNSP